MSWCVEDTNEGCAWPTAPPSRLGSRWGESGRETLVLQTLHTGGSPAGIRFSSLSVTPYSKAPSPPFHLICKFLVPFFHFNITTF